MHSGWERWPFKNHVCETKTTSRLGEDCLEILQADYTSEMWKAIIKPLLIILLLVCEKCSLHTECTYSQIQWQNPSQGGFIGRTLAFGAVLAELVRGCNFCLFGGWDTPAQVVSLQEAVLSGRSMKWDSRFWATQWDIKEVEELKKSVNTEVLNILQLHLPSSAFWLPQTSLCLLTLNLPHPQFQHISHHCISFIPATHSCVLQAYPLFPGASLFSWSIYRHDQHHTCMSTPAHPHIWLQTRTSPDTVSNKPRRKNNHLAKFFLQSMQNKVSPKHRSLI